MNVVCVQMPGIQKYIVEHNKPKLIHGQMVSMKINFTFMTGSRTMLYVLIDEFCKNNGHHTVLRRNNSYRQMTSIGLALRNKEKLFWVAEMLPFVPVCFV